jgi:hypothetical protein
VESFPSSRSEWRARRCAVAGVHSSLSPTPRAKGAIRESLPCYNLTERQQSHRDNTKPGQHEHQVTRLHRVCQTRKLPIPVCFRRTDTLGRTHSIDCRTHNEPRSKRIFEGATQGTLGAAGTTSHQQHSIERRRISPTQSDEQLCARETALFANHTSVLIRTATSLSGRQHPRAQGTCTPEYLIVGPVDKSKRQSPKVRDKNQRKHGASRPLRMQFSDSGEVW